MFLRESRHRRKGGQVVSYLQIAESTWDPAKRRSRTRIVLNCGRADEEAVVERLRRLARSILRRSSAEEIVAQDSDWKFERAWPYGDVYVLEKLWERVGLPGLLAKRASRAKLKFPVERAIFAMVANRACAPRSKLSCWEQWLAEDVRIEGAGDFELHHLYRAMDFLEANREPLQEALYHNLCDLFRLDVDLIFYDTTSLHFEVDEEDRPDPRDPEGRVRGSRPAGRKRYAPLRRRGKSKNGRGDAPQVVVGLAVTRDGLPLRHWIFPGNTVDVTTVEGVKEDLRGWKLGRCVFVGDAGMVSEENLRSLRRSGGRYVVCMPMRRGDEVTREVLTRPGRYREVAGNLRVKTVEVGEGERRRRYAVCFNPQEAERQGRHRQGVLAELEAELASLKDAGGGVHSKRACQLRASGRYGRYLRTTRGGGLKVDAAKVASEQRLDGKFVVHSNDDTLTAEDMALGYKQLMRVEEAWRTLKSGLRLRPVYHWVPHRIHAHVFLTVLALLLERLAEIACGDTWRNVRRDLRQVQLAKLHNAHGVVWQVTEPGPAARRRLRKLGLPPPPVLLAAQ